MKFSKRKIARRVSDIDDNVTDLNEADLDMVYGQKKEAALATEVVKSANVMKSYAKERIADVANQGDVDFEGLFKAKDEVEATYKSLEGEFSEDSRAADSLAGSALSSFDDDLVNVSAERVLADEEKKKAGIFEQCVNLAKSGINQDNPESIMKAMFLTDKYLLAMYGASKNSQEIQEMIRRKNSSILSGAIDKAVEKGDLDTAYDLYSEALEDEGRFSEADLDEVKESIISGKRSQVHTELFDKYVADGSPDSTVEWLGGQVLDIGIGRDAGRAEVVFDDEDVYDTVRFIGDSEVKRKKAVQEEL